VEEKEPQPNWRKAKWEEMRRELAGSNLISNMVGVTVEEAWKVFKDKVEGRVKKFVPPRRLRNNNRLQWLTQAILREIRRKSTLWKSLKMGG
jgi:hypothetical protein